LRKIYSKSSREWRGPQLANKLRKSSAGLN
jgi:hypothetical protein